MLDEETFIPAKYTMRRINDGIQKKTRDIAIPRFWPDQCVHHAFVRIFKQIVLHSAYPFSCGCVPGKGTHGAKTAIEKWIRKDPKHTKYVLKLDVRKCYPTMNHEELRKKLQRRIKDKKFLRLADRIIASFQPTDGHTTKDCLPETDGGRHSRSGSLPRHGSATFSFRTSTTGRRENRSRAQREIRG